MLFGTVNCFNSVNILICMLNIWQICYRCFLMCILSTQLDSLSMLSCLHYCKHTIQSGKSIWKIWRSNNRLNMHSLFYKICILRMKKYYPMYKNHNSITSMRCKIVKSCRNAIQRCMRCSNKVISRLKELIQKNIWNKRVIRSPHYRNKLCNFADNQCNFLKVDYKMCH